MVAQADNLLPVAILKRRVKHPLRDTAAVAL